MSLELWGVIAVIVSALFTVAEFLAHYFLARRLTAETTEYREVRRRLNCLVTGVAEAPTERCRQGELKTMAETVDGNDRFYDMVSDAVDVLREEGGDADHLDSVEQSIVEAVDPITIFAKMLDNGDVYQRGYACRRLADLQAVEYLPNIGELSESRDKELSYNAGMALAQFGDAERVASYLIRIQGDRSYSGRIVSEIFEVFCGDREKLTAILLEQSSEYMQNSVIKAVEHFALARFRPVYVAGAIGNDKQRKIACVKALGAFGDVRDEQIFQMAAQDKDWVIRCAAVKGLSNLKTPTALATVRLAMYDKEWWVRRNAASALLRMGVSHTVLEEILAGSDRFAADALKSELYKEIGV